MTTTRRALACASCGFATDHMLHYRNCVPTSQWPYGLRERKAAAMSHGEDDIMEIDGQRFNAGPIPRETVVRAPEPEKPRGLAEYRRLHPEANPLTAERITARETRTREDGGTDEWERVVGVREAINQAVSCDRCHRPMLDRLMHITCQPVDGTVIPASAPGNRLKRDDVPLVRRVPLVHTTADVRTGANWYDALPTSEGAEVDEDELRDYVGTTEAPEPVDTTLRDRLAAEQAAWNDDPPVDDRACPTCGRVSKSAAGNVTHQRSHR